MYRPLFVNTGNRDRYFDVLGFPTAEGKVDGRIWLSTVIRLDVREAIGTKECADFHSS
jgi:hypothetical protein